MKHIKSLYISRYCGVSVKIHNAHGGGPDHVVDSAIRQSRNAAYDRVETLLDTDVEMSATAQQRTKVEENSDYSFDTLFRRVTAQNPR